MTVFDPFKLHPLAPYHLSYGGLDRDDTGRKSNKLLGQLLLDPKTRFLPFWRSLNFFSKKGNALSVMCSLNTESASRFFEEAEIIYLGCDRNQKSYVCLDLSKYEKVVLDPLASFGIFGDLREADFKMSGDDGSIMGYARAMCHWHAKNKHCSSCGSHTISNNSGHTRNCEKKECGYIQFPRTDPAVIMAITFKDKILLGRQADWPNGMLSVLAGFVEPGETPEHAVAREVFEEAGVLVQNIVYQYSQPWPFPASLMLGFTGKAESVDLSVNINEIEVARWFTKEEIKTFDGDNFHLPSKLSISRRLIDDWLLGA
jgi:NAD+ diphosphatase